MNMVRYIGLLALLLGFYGCGGASSAESMPAYKMEQALVRVGLSAEKAHHHRYAADIFKRALHLNPQRIELGEHLGYNYAASGQYHKSLEAYMAVKAQMPENTEVILKIAQNYLALQDYYPALHAYEEVLKLKAGQAPLAYNGLGILLDRFGRYRLAKQCYRQGMAQDKTLTSMVSNYAMSLALSGHIDQSLETMHGIIMKRSTPRVKANYALLKSTYVLAAEKKLPQSAWRRYLRERLFAHERAIPRSLFIKLRRRTEKVAQHWCRKRSVSHARVG